MRRVALVLLLLLGATLNGGPTWPEGSTLTLVSQRASKAGVGIGLRTDQGGR